MLAVCKVFLKHLRQFRHVSQLRMASTDDPRDGRTFLSMGSTNYLNHFPDSGWLDSDESLQELSVALSIQSMQPALEAKGYVCFV